MLRWILIIASAFLTLTLPGCIVSPPEIAGQSGGEISFARTRESDEHKFIVSIIPLKEPIAINEIHSWRIRLTSIAGVPVRKAEIFIGGGMPDHGHGFPTRPRVTEQADAGEYLLEGVKFSMQGRWEIKLGIQASGEFDLVAFNTMVSLPAASK